MYGPTSLELKLPPFVDNLLQNWRLDSDHAGRLNLAIELARQNVEAGTGGPFGAYVLSPEGEIVGVGVNLVVPTCNCTNHAEKVAIQMALKQVGNFSFEGEGYSLYTSAQPCIMCFGACWWSGLSRIVYGAPAEMVEEITGFKEGPVPSEWKELLAQHEPACEVIGPLCEGFAREVLEDYMERGMPVYNASGS